MENQEDSTAEEFISLPFPVRPELFFNTEHGGRLCIARSVYDEKERQSEENYQKFSENEEEDEFDYEFKETGLQLSFALGFEDRGDDDEQSEPWDICYCRTRLSDAEGNWWEAKTLFDCEVLIENIEDWRREGWAGSCEQNADAWPENSQARVLLKGIRGYYDDRVGRHIILDEQIYNVMFKYQAPVFDIAYFGNKDSLFDPPQLVVRVSQFYVRGEKDMPSFCYSMNCETLMFYANTQGLPMPLVFKKVGEGAPRQALICHLPNGQQQ